MKLTLPPAGDSAGQLILERGPFAGRVYRVAFGPCPDPVCTCDILYLHCVPETTAEPAEATEPLSLALNLRRQHLSTLIEGVTEDEAELADAVSSELSDEHFEAIRQFNFDCKTLLTEQTDPGDLDTIFPLDCEDGGMAGYREILPYARLHRFTVGQAGFLLDDHYCVLPDCGCKVAILQPLRIAPTDETEQERNPDRDAPNPPEEEPPTYRYEYGTRRIDLITGSNAILPPQAFLDAIHEVLPDFEGFLAARHNQLRDLYRRFLKRHGGSHPAWQLEEELENLPAPQQPIRAAQKPGRNDPCPCGSGKKYKKCCGGG